MTESLALTDVPPAASDALSDNGFRFTVACVVRPPPPHTHTLYFIVEAASEQSRSLSVNCCEAVNARFDFRHPDSELHMFKFFCAVS